MTMALNLSEETQGRVAAIAARTNLTVEQIVVDALENGHSLEWQERFLEKVAAGLADAREERFATDDEVDRVVNKYRTE
ncbi:transcriptional regulator [Devosia rhizoryzae]|uniref:Transcriptional regulator n=2 Tax=Devosia rhizoryzae TaxID=2774137 RepID=A0ABX7C6T3_9HYPH|nr:transcriptional regulator [Devosia rhizoryzae]